MMKKRLLIALAVASQIVMIQAGPVGRWLETVHDFGAFDEDMGNVTTTFRLVNDGDEPLSILSAHASCGCTAPSYDRAPIAPGDTALMTVTYNPFARPGKFDKKVKVKTNDAVNPNSVLAIKGVVIGSANTLRAHYPIEVGKLKLRNSILNFGELTKGRTKTSFLDGYNHSSDTICPVITGLPPYIDVNIAPAEVPPGQQMTLTFFCNTSKAPELWGLNSAKATIRPDAGAAESGEIEFITVLNEDFSALTDKQREQAPRIAVSTSSVDLGRVKRGEKVTSEVVVQNYGKEPLLLRRVSSADKSVSVKPGSMKVKPGKQTTIRVTVDTSDESMTEKMVNSRLTIIANDPQRPVSAVRIVGEIIE
ncbi:MAG: DUF1573 domain-containing protein [Muribaculum sp.]|nr:DUF1573 domain-containing protein [Muribaculaceae bacterium]MCM1080328.1 DUF1573 domain-containing protein [Muribaculum sp.]